MRQEAKVSYNEIRDNINLESTLRLNAQTLGVILDFDCPSSDLILNQVLLLLLIRIIIIIQQPVLCNCQKLQIFVKKIWT